MKIVLPSPKFPLKIGTRGSPLALAQANETRERLSNAFNIHINSFKILVIKTTGDKIIDRPLKEIGGKGLFTKEIEQELLEGKIDIAVHSMKDMPVEQPNGLILDTYLPREDPRDALVANSSVNNLKNLPNGTIVGTSSMRRHAQLKFRRPDLQIVEFRGNVQTRLKKLADGVANCTFLAMAGLNRLGMSHIATSVISVDEMLPAIAQGAIGVERRVSDQNTKQMLEAIHDASTGKILAAERAFLAALDGSCETPIAGAAILIGNTVRLRGEILRPDGSECVADDKTAPIEDAAELGKAMGKELRIRAGSDFFYW